MAGAIAKGGCLLRLHHRKFLRLGIEVQKCVVFSLARYSSKAESFLSGSNANYLESQYVEWASKPGTIDSSWDSFYNSLTNKTALEIDEFQDDYSPHTVKEQQSDPHRTLTGDAAERECLEYQKQKEIKRAITMNLEVRALVYSFQNRGHLVARIDPLNMMIGGSSLLSKDDDIHDMKTMQAKLVNRDVYHLLQEQNMEKMFYLGDLHTDIGGDDEEITLRELTRRLEYTYCGPIGYEYLHLFDREAHHYIRSRIEPPGSRDLTVAHKRRVMKRLVKAVWLEKYFATKWPAEKRFGLDGAESFIVMLEEVVDAASAHGIETLILAMPHRGRLNMLVNVCRKQLVDIFAQFKRMEPMERVLLPAHFLAFLFIKGSGDIKYHLGTYIHRFIKSTKRYIKVAMSANPSHLEVVTPIAIGKTKAEQYYKSDSNGNKAMAIIMHGDAAFTGQGLVYETMQVSNTKHFTTYGVIHIICNNQLGYTTEPRDSRPTPYCSDLAKCTSAPVFHVNCDEPEAVAHVARLAVDYRCKFHGDAVLDLVCYRRFGHSEEDEPSFTQPLMYKAIRQMETVDVLYARRLKAEGVITDADTKRWKDEYYNALNGHFEMSKKIEKLRLQDWIDTPWTGFHETVNPNMVQETGVSEKTLTRILEHFAKEPHAFEVHKGITRILGNRKKLMKEGLADWAMGEAVAIASLLRQGYNIRFTGQDVERGTMAHRHHVYHHQRFNGAQYRVLNQTYPDQGVYHLYNSPLSEYGVLGFECGYSYYNPRQLVIWEAQYGDFADTAQPMFDTFISNAESKWISQSGLVVQLPHGIDGAGPEHSSGRIERYLLQCDDDPDILPELDVKNFELEQLRVGNWIVANVTNSANYCHLIRRQMALPFRKPLILFTPKIGLKHPFYFSPLKDFLRGTRFQRAIRDSGPASKNAKGVQRLIFCSGKVVIDILNVIKEKKLEDKIAVCRIEQLFPFPYDIVLRECVAYENAEVVFVQEEHKNQGPLPFVRPRLQTLLDKNIRCITRPPSAASAAGVKWIHEREYKQLMAEVVDIGAQKSKKDC